MATSDAIDRLRQIASILRRSIEPGLARDAVTGRVVSYGACLHAAALLATSLNRFGLARARIRGGGDGEYGMRDTAGAWRGHYWVEVQLPGGGAYVIDITADQFGWDPVLVMVAGDAAEFYRPGPQDVVDDAAHDIAAEFGIAADSIGLDWPAKPNASE